MANGMIMGDCLQNNNYQFDAFANTSEQLAPNFITEYHSTNRCYMEANKPCNSGFFYRFFLWLIGVPIFFDFLRIRINQRNSSSERFL